MGRRLKKGMFITFEGIEGSGKSTHAKRTAQYLRKKGYAVLLLREPGGTTISEQIRKILLDKKNKKMTVAAELFLYNAARAQLVSEIIQPALQAGKMVLCDRFYDSTIAYQCYGGKMNQCFAREVNHYAAGGLKPRMTFLLDSDVKRGLARAGRWDRMELKSIAFHTRVRKGFLALARREKKRFFIVPELSIDEGWKRIERKLHALFG